MVQGLGTVIYHVGDLNEAKAWYSRAFQQKPYFDESFYVGFNIGGYELGLDPNQAGSTSGRGGTVAYWRVGKIDPAVEHFVTMGATLVAAAQDVGGDIKVATVADPFGNLIGLIENPHFTLLQSRTSSPVLAVGRRARAYSGLINSKTSASTASHVKAAVRVAERVAILRARGAEWWRSIGPGPLAFAGRTAWRPPPRAVNPGRAPSMDSCRR